MAPIPALVHIGERRDSESRLCCRGGTLPELNKIQISSTFPSVHPPRLREYCLSALFYHCSLLVVVLAIEVLILVHVSAVVMNALMNKNTTGIEL